MIKVFTALVPGPHFDFTGKIIYIFAKQDLLGIYVNQCSWTPYLIFQSLYCSSKLPKGKYD